MFGRFLGLGFNQQGPCRKQKKDKDKLLLLFELVGNTKNITEFQKESTKKLNGPIIFPRDDKPNPSRKWVFYHTYHSTSSIHFWKVRERNGYH